MEGPNKKSLGLEQARIRDLEEQVALDDKEIERLEGELQKAQENIRALEERLKESEAYAEQITEQFNAIAPKYDYLKRRHDELTALVEKLRGQLKRCEQR